MCGRYGLVDPKRMIADMVFIPGVTFPEELRPRYNIAPSQNNPVVATDDLGTPRGALMRWGLVPFWDKSEKPKFAPINARSEDVLSKPMFRQSVQKRRCLVLADGFYEWKRVDEKTKIPHFISLRDGAPFFIAGIYELATEVRPETYALLTTGPNELMEAVHNRMPVILDQEAGKRWLQPGALAADQVADLCRPFQADRMRAYPVSSIVNAPRNDVPECIVPAGAGAGI
jgi:putative SOS response-associated peptidase YedK